MNKSQVANLSQIIEKLFVSLHSFVYLAIVLQMAPNVRNARGALSQIKSYMMYAGECVYETVFCYLSYVCMKKKKKIEFDGIFTNVPPSIAIKKRILFACHLLDNKTCTVFSFVSFVLFFL